MSEAADERIIALDELNERQEELLKQVKAGHVDEHEPDTQEQLRTLARLGHLDMAQDDVGNDRFSVPGGKPKRAPKAKE